MYIHLWVTSVKSKPENEGRKNGIPKGELHELKDRLARTEQALTKLMEATKLISEKIDPKGKKLKNYH